MRFQGRLAKWNDDKGFGFITPNGGGDGVFLHIKALHRGASRPVEGDLIAYELELDERKRPRAKNAARVGEKIVKAPDGGGVKAPLFAAVFCLVLFGGALAGFLHLKLVLAYVVASLITFSAYWLDKRAAQAGRRRTPENTLHLFALAGGWLGALAAQRLLRHKSVKQEFLTVFWVTVLINCSAFGWLMTESGRAFLHGLGV